MDLDVEKMSPEQLKATVIHFRDALAPEPEPEYKKSIAERYSADLPMFTAPRDAEVALRVTFFRLHVCLRCTCTFTF